ncbi:MAG: MFS transporter [Alphaproteobacteria bacterium]|nr:MAG: MFS transporter [Alphaproteobacteria bacterium]
MRSHPVPLAEAAALPRWRQPVVLLVVMAAAMPFSFATWNALLNNFVIEVAKFDGWDIGLLHTVREIPGFAAVGVIAVILLVREQRLALISLVFLGGATAVTANFPSFGGLMITTFIASIGFHYYETVNQSLQLQWLPKEKAPRVLGWILAAGSAGSLIAYSAIVLFGSYVDAHYKVAYWAGGGVTLAVALFCWFAYPQFEAPHPQVKRMVLRRRYWLYYGLQFMSGARRQIFVVFAAFMMVEKFGMKIHELTALFLINYIANMVLAPLVGRLIGRFGERRALIFEYVGLATVFVLYGGLYWFDWPLWFAAALYVADHLLFAMAFAMKTYFQKIADPGDIAPTAAVAFTINHIAAVTLPAPLGLLWLYAPGYVFALAAGMAGLSLCLALMVPRHPVPGNETLLRRTAAAQPAE